MTAIAACLRSAAAGRRSTRAPAPTGPASSRGRPRRRGGGRGARPGRGWADGVPESGGAAREIGAGSALLDGEIVALDDKGSSSFSALQQAISEGGRGLTLFLFDALEVDGEDLTGAPNIERKARLATLLGEGHRPRGPYAEQIVGPGRAL